MVRTRFAPSPTGFLHIGGVRTALYSWLYARQAGGQFILRIEDTDQERSTQASIDAILEGMSWLGLNWDEGPFYQMQRLDRYQHYIEQLLSEGKAYRCNCSSERLEQLRESQMQQKLKPRYDGHCRGRQVSADEPHVIRFMNPVEGTVDFSDLVYGDISVANEELDDLVLIRTDGVPTYNFSVVIDDWEMEISHVIRGDDHINNTPRQINLLKALGAPIPTYAHLPMILGKDGKRLSKRHGAVNVLHYKEEGFLPEAVLSYLARLGWSHGDQELFSQEELIELFSFKHVHRGGATYDLDKFQWVNQHYLRALPAEVIQQEVCALDSAFEPVAVEVFELLKSRVQTIRDYIEKARYFIEAPQQYDATAQEKFITETSLQHLEQVYEQLKALEHWDSQAISTCVKAYAQENSLKFPQIAQPLRIAVSGSTETPSINEVLALLGQSEALARIGNALDYFKN